VGKTGQTWENDPYKLSVGKREKTEKKEGLGKKQYGTKKTARIETLNLKKVTLILGDLSSYNSQDRRLPVVGEKGKKSKKKEL